jgi:hypothetical protein
MLGELREGVQYSVAALDQPGPHDAPCGRAGGTPGAHGARAGRGILGIGVTGDRGS